MSTPTRTAARAATPSPRPQRRPALWVIGTVIAVCLVGAALLVALRASRPGVLPNVLLADLEVGGLDRTALEAAVAAYEQHRQADAVNVLRPALAGRPDSRTQQEFSAGDVGYRLDIEATADAIWARGRQSNPVAALADHLRAFTDTFVVDPVQSVDEGQLQAWAEQTAEELRLDPVEGSVRIEGATVSTVDPEPGAQIDAQALAAAAEQAALEDGDSVVAAETQRLEPETQLADVTDVAGEARQALSAPVTMRKGQAAMTLTPQLIGSVLRVEVDDDGNMQLTADPQAMAVAIGDPPAFESPPVDATFRIEGDTVSVVDAQIGFAFDAQMAADQLLEVATGEGPRDVELAGRPLEPERTTEEAHALGITTKVSEFTTHHACCQNRVTNIHRMADMMRGVVIEPGETFSVNTYIGPRTRAKGFVADGAIVAGEFVEAVGGGVSQFATTMFNAAFFGGYEIVEHKPHSQYISRYPEGREATLNYNNVDLKIHNNSPHGILVDTSYTSTSITVAFYGTPWVQVETTTGPRRNFTQPETIIRRTTELPPGEERVIQTGEGQGFDVTVTRTLRYPDGRVETEEYFTRYVARPEIIERGV